MSLVSHGHSFGADGGVNISVASGTVYSSARPVVTCSAPAPTADHPAPPMVGHSMSRPAAEYSVPAPVLGIDCSEHPEDEGAPTKRCGVCHIQCADNGMIALSYGHYKSWVTRMKGAIKSPSCQVCQEGVHGKVTPLSQTTIWIYTSVSHHHQDIRLFAR